MPTYVALTTLTGKLRAEALGKAVERLDPAPTGVGVFEVEDGSGMWEIGGYFVERPDDIGLRLLAAVHGAKPFAISELPETDWVAHVHRELAPVQAGRFFVYGSHDADKVPDDVEPLLIEAAMAFGTGHHGTTLGCLRAVEMLSRTGYRPDAVIDVGCGTAVLAMAAARVWPATIMASDIDPVAVEVARANVSANNLVGRVRCLDAAGFDHPELRQAAPYDLIFANILTGPLIALAPDLVAALAPGGHAILSGILNEQADTVADVYSGFGTSVAHRQEIGDWTTITLCAPA